LVSGTGEGSGVVGSDFDRSTGSSTSLTGEEGLGDGSGSSICVGAVAGGTGWGLLSGMTEGSGGGNGSGSMTGGGSGVESTFNFVTAEGVGGGGGDGTGSVATGVDDRLCAIAGNRVGGSGIVRGFMAGRGGEGNDGATGLSTICFFSSFTSGIGKPRNGNGTPMFPASKSSGRAFCRVEEEGILRPGNF
jgi:hypothetical protein